MTVKTTKTKKPRTKPVGQGVKVEDKVPAPTAPKGIPIEDMIEYRKKGLTLDEVARLTGCTRQTVHSRLQALDLEGLEKYRDNKDTVIEYHQRRVSKALTDDDIKKMSGLQKLIGIKLADEAIRTIRGQSAQIIDHRVVTADLKDVLQRMSQAGILADTDSPDNVTDV